MAEAYCIVTKEVPTLALLTAMKQRNSALP